MKQMKCSKIFFRNNKNLIKLMQSRSCTKRNKENRKSKILLAQRIKIEYKIVLIKLIRTIPRCNERLHSFVFKKDVKNKKIK